MATPLRWLVLVCVAAASLLCQQTAKKAVTLDDFLSHHREETIVPTWAPDGKAFEYEQQGTIFRYDVGLKKAREWFKAETLKQVAVTPIKPKEFEWQNRRVSAETYQWFPDSQQLLASVNGELFRVHPDGGFEQITKTDIAEEDAQLSPDGKLVVYRWRSNLYVIDLATKRRRQLTSDGTRTRLNGQLDWVYPEELDLGTAVWWSPDSRDIAYLQFDVSREFIYPHVDLLGERALSEPQRYPQAGTPNAEVRLGRISAAGGPTTWMQVGETSSALLARVAWLPDASAIAVERLSRIQDKLDLLFCNAASGKTHIILHEQSKTWLNASDNLFFLASRREFLWTSERSGFRHIYRFSDKGKLLGQLTSGDWGVITITAIDEARQRVFYTSSEHSPLETQLYEVSLAGGERTRITKEEGTHEIHQNDQGSYFVDTYSSLDRAPQTVLAEPSGEHVGQLQAIDAKLAEEYALAPEQILSLKTEDGTVLYGSLIKPADFKEQRKYPAIVYVYGGPGVQSVRNRWKGLSWEQVLAQRGYVVWQLDNRGSTGRGVAFEAGIYHQLGKLEVADQRRGVEYLVAMGFVDPERLGITGWSYGGYMTIHSMLLAPDLFKVGVAGAPVTDWHNYDTIYTERYMGLPEENSRAYDASSNVKNASELQGKLLIVHNLEDDNVLFQNSMQMADALEKANRPFLMQIYPQKTHGVSGDLRKPLYEQMTSFFDQHLKPTTRANPNT